MIKKLYVSVSAEFDTDGNMRPSMIHLEDGRDIRIKKVKNAVRAASLKAGGQGTRYVCSIGAKDIYLFCEDMKWFVEWSE